MIIEKEQIIADLVQVRDRNAEERNHLIFGKS